MPNTAAEIGKSISLYTMGQFVNETHQETLQLLLRGIGTSQLCTEEEVHQLTAVTGSAPAFLYYFAESLIEATKSYGVDEATAKHLVIQMISGSASMLEQTQDPANLREQVTTPVVPQLKVSKLYMNIIFHRQFKSSRSNKQKARGNNMNLTSLNDYTTLHNGVKMPWFGLGVLK